jgi:hypothetical protein
MMGKRFYLSLPFYTLLIVTVAGLLFVVAMIGLKVYVDREVEFRDLLFGGLFTTICLFAWQTALSKIIVSTEQLHIVAPLSKEKIVEVSSIAAILNFGVLLSVVYRDFDGSQRNLFVPRLAKEFGFLLLLKEANASIETQGF